MTTNNCWCSLPWGLGALKYDQNKMKIFGANSRGLLNFVMMKPKISEPFEVYLSRHFWGHWEWDFGFYEYLMNSTGFSTH